MHRDILTNLMQWKDGPRRKPLVFTGVRQFCKTYKPAYGFKLSKKNIGVNKCEETKTISLPLYLCWNIDSYVD